MRVIALIALLFFSCLSSFSQVKIPLASPKSKLVQIVGLTNFEINYHRPSIKERIVYGELVPFGKHWRTGANENTTISFDQNIEIKGNKISKGHYSLYTIPRADLWEIILYKDTNNWGVPKQWDQNKVVLSFNSSPITIMESVESFTIDFNDFRNDSATLNLMWERTKISIPIKVPTQEEVEKSITETLSGPSHKEYFQSAQFYHQSNKKLDQALLWINKAIELANQDKKAPFWYYRLQSLIYAKQGNLSLAIEAAKTSLSGAIKANNQDYIRQNNRSLQQWLSSKE